MSYSETSKFESPLCFGRLLCELVPITQPITQDGGCMDKMERRTKLLVTLGPQWEKMGPETCKEINACSEWILLQNSQ